MNVIFIEPAFPHNQREFARALHATGANVIGIGERPRAHLDGELVSWLHDYVQVASVVHEEPLLAAVREVQARLWVHRLEATVEAHILPAAVVREAACIPGTSAHTAWLCRDKPAMKDALRAAGVPCAQSTRANTPGDARAFAGSIGYPLIIKPPAGAGAAGTYKVDDAAALERIIAESGLADGQAVAIEEFVDGHEGYSDTLTVNGMVAHEFITHYYPNVLEAMRHRWISPQMVTTNRIEAPGYAEVRGMTRKVIGILGIGTSATHMEWFFGPRGLRFSEIGARPPGVGQWDVYNTANDFDLYLEWASAVTRSTTMTRPSRRYAAGMIALRPDRDGVVTGYSGLEEIEARYGDCIVAAHLPEVGTPTQPVEAGYMANAWMRVRHPDYDRLCQVLDEIGMRVKMHAA